MNPTSFVGHEPPGVDTNTACARARRVLRSFQGQGRLLVYGAGGHTLKILPVLTEFADVIAGVIDDSPLEWGRPIGPWCVEPPPTSAQNTAQGILISSDAMQDTLVARAREHFGARCEILTMHKPPFRDGDHLPTLPPNGERQIGATLAEIEIGHRARYYWALQHIPDHAVVLDAACGNGYGAHILTTGGAIVVGVDVCPQAVEFAKHHYATGNVEFHAGAVDDQHTGVARLATEGQRFDAVVSMETIEHIADPWQAMRNFNAVLRTGGELFCSTPNAEIMSLEDAEFHRRHFELVEMLAMLRATGFELVEWYGQEGMQILRRRSTNRQRYLLFHARKSRDALFD